LIVNALTIAGSDPSGGAGIQADLKTFAALGTYGMSVITAVTAQNTRGVRSVRMLDAGFGAEQLDALYKDVKIDTVEIGMVASTGVVEVIADRLRGRPGCNVVLDPVMIAKRGDRLLTEDTIAAMRDLLVPLARLITPNLSEAAALIGGGVPQTHADMVRAVQLLHRLGSDWVLLKGGHLAGADSTELPFDGQTLTGLPGRRAETRNTHGIGCTLSAAIAALLPRLDMVRA